MIKIAASLRKVHHRHGDQQQHDGGHHHHHREAATSVTGLYISPARRLRLTQCSSFSFTVFLGSLAGHRQLKGSTELARSNVFAMAFRTPRDPARPTGGAGDGLMVHAGHIQSGG